MLRPCTIIVHLPKERVRRLLAVRRAARMVIPSHEHPQTPLEVDGQTKHWKILCWYNGGTVAIALAAPPVLRHFLSSMEARADHSSDPFYFRNFDGGLTNAEFFWRDHYKFLEEKGYRLRPRYSPDWKPSWFQTKKRRLDSEDGLAPFVSFHVVELWTQSSSY